MPRPRPTRDLRAAAVLAISIFAPSCSTWLGMALILGCILLRCCCRRPSRDRHGRCSWSTTCRSRTTRTARSSASRLILAYSVMALGLNIIVGFAGLLDLGYVAFFALGALTAGWFMSGFFVEAGKGGKGIHVLVADPAASLPGIHLNFLLVCILAVVICAVAGMLIGLPTLRLRGDYIAIVTLAFGEIIGRIVINGDEHHDCPSAARQLTNGDAQGITPIDKIDFPSIEPFKPLDLSPWYWIALGDGRCSSCS